tara:strand:+ start:432 stop:935 length:504 start_codon:yes stop_codon:yes gene_type:complete
MADAFTAAWNLVKAPWYYHATPEDNLMSILSEGIKPGMDGVVYATKDPDLSARWMSYARQDSPRIANIPFWRDEGDPRIEPAGDHSPMMIPLLMGSDYKTREGDVVESSEPIPREDILPNIEARGRPSNEDRSAGNPGIMMYDNPMYSDQMQEMMKKLRRMNEERGD